MNMWCFLTYCVSRNSPVAPESIIAALVVLLNRPLSLTGTRKCEEVCDCIELIVHSVVEV